MSLCRISWVLCQMDGNWLEMERMGRLILMINMTVVVLSIRMARVFVVGIVLFMIIITAVVVRFVVLDFVNRCVVRLAQDSVLIKQSFETGWCVAGIMMDSILVWAEVSMVRLINHKGFMAVFSGNFLHVDRVMNQHRSVPVDECLEDSVFVGQKSNGRLDHVICLRLVKL